MHHLEAMPYTPYLQRYRSGEWRGPIFRDLILADAGKLNRDTGELVFLDIGCGGGFDSDPELQRSLAAVAGRYLGVEPDAQMPLGEMFHETYRCRFEEAPIEPESADVAFAVMVLEHFEKPQQFWDKVHRILKPGGVFWGFTVDARHWFVSASLLMERLRIKDLYLDMLHGKRGEQRYENYGVFYRSNTPRDISGMTRSFSSRTCLNFHRIGQTDFYFPRPLRWIPRVYDRVALGAGLPGSILAVRVVK